MQRASKRAAHDTRARSLHRREGEAIEKKDGLAEQWEYARPSYLCVGGLWPPRQPLRVDRHRGSLTAKQSEDFNAYVPTT